jgi:hypothetical protein
MVHATHQLVMRRVIDSCKPDTSQTKDVVCFVFEVQLQRVPQMMRQPCRFSTARSCELLHVQAGH